MYEKHPYLTFDDLLQLCKAEPLHINRFCEFHDHFQIEIHDILISQDKHLLVPASRLAFVYMSSVLGFTGTNSFSKWSRTLKNRCKADCKVIFPVRIHNKFPRLQHGASISVNADFALRCFVFLAWHCTIRQLLYSL